MIQIVRWVLLFAPIGAFALAVPLAMHLGNAAAGAIAFYLAAMVGFHAAIIAIIYLVVPLVTGTPIARFARAMLPAQVVVVSTRSSLAALPAMLEGAQRELDISPDVAGFTIPLGVALLRANIAVAWIIQVIFLGKLYGVTMSATARSWGRRRLDRVELRRPGDPERRLPHRRAIPAQPRPADSGDRNSHRARRDPRHLQDAAQRDGARLDGARPRATRPGDPARRGRRGGQRLTSAVVSWLTRCSMVPLVEQWNGS